MERKTKQKEIVIEYLKENTDKHLTIQEIQVDLNNKIGLTTIYRIINDLIKKGVVSKIPFENKQGYCYKYNSEIKECKGHYHLVCENCNKLFHFESSEISKIKQKADKNEEFLINDNRIVFYGLCKNCKK